MCGFVGSASTSTMVDKEWLLKASQSLYHRGPNDSNQWISKNNQLGFAHRRLSIIDISKNARQPFINTTNDAVMVFNGEIYNHVKIRSNLEKLGYKFKSNCDTEVLLNSYHYWGYECLQFIRGMYSFVIYDMRNNKIFAARDLCGEKPFYYTYSNKTLYFASEVKSLISNNFISTELSLESLDFYLATGHTPSNNSIFKGIKKLQPSEALSYDLNDGLIKTWIYWNPPEFSSQNNFCEEETLVEELELNLEASVESQLISDVPLGICLSGGIDSSLITALASRHAPNISTFTAIFPGHQSFDESHYAKIISKEFSTSHNEIVIDNPSYDILQNLTEYYDEPLADSSSIATYLLFSSLSEYCSVALGGDGSDELFGGYSHHSPYFSSFSNYFPKPILNKLYNKFLKYFPIGFKGRNLAFKLLCQQSLVIPPYPYLFDFIYRKKLLSNHINSSPTYDHLFCHQFEKGDDITFITMKKDFTNYLSEDILVKTDRASMANSLEIRSPFLSKELIEFSFSKLPTKYKASNKRKKILLKKLAQKILPSNLNIERKQGFSVPLAKWLEAGPFKDFIYEILMDENCFFEKETVREILRNQEKGYSNSERIYSLVMFELWRRKYIL